MQSPPSTSAYAVDRLLAVQADPQGLSQLRVLATELGYEVRHAGGAADLAAAFQAGPGFATVIVGWNVSQAAMDGSNRVGHQDALELISAVRKLSGTSQVLVAVGRGITRDQCSELIRAGVDGFIQIHDGLAERELLRARLDRAKRRFLLAGQPVSPGGGIFDSTGFVGCSRAMGDVLRRAARAAGISDVPVLIYGESGTGKQLLAETVHRLDQKRGRRRMIAVNCAAIAGTLADSALFGHVKGAYTGATTSRLGHFRSADGGTVMLDEIGELDIQLQPKLLRVLQEGLVLPVGADEEQPVDVRVIAATNRPLEALVEEGRFRLDLFQRLNVIRIDIPPLRDRPEDIPLLVRFFLKRYVGYCSGGVPITGVDADVLQYLSTQPFEGNVRELENLIRRVLAFKTQGDRITMADLAAVRSESAKRTPKNEALLARELVESARNMMGSGHSTFADLLDECERLLLSLAMEQSQRTQTDLARDLGLSRRTLYNKLKKHRL